MASSEYNRPEYQQALRITSVEILMFNDLPTFWHNVVRLVDAIISVVELTQSEFEGFPGPVGRLVEPVDAPLLKLLVNMILGNRHGIIWVEGARDILGLKQAA